VASLQALRRLPGPAGASQRPCSTLEHYVVGYLADARQLGRVWSGEPVVMTTARQERGAMASRLPAHRGGEK